MVTKLFKSSKIKVKKNKKAEEVARRAFWEKEGEGRRKKIENSEKRGLTRRGKELTLINAR